MMKSKVAFGLLAAIVLPLLVAGCGLFDYEEREPWRAQAEAACFSRKMVKLTSLIQEIDEIDGKGICGLDRPLKVAALADGSVQIGGRAVVMSCPVTAALERWVRDAIMPAALERYGVPVVELKTMGTYNCRSRNNVPGARLSEHAFANAFDFSGVVLANGYTVTVKKGWRGSAADRAFLRQIHAGACGPFTTVLGPGSDGLHEDHLHLDLARHNAKGSTYCRPKPQMPAPATDAPAFMTETPVAEAPPPPAGWPRVLPQSMEAADAAMPPASIPASSPGGPVGLDAEMLGAAPSAGAGNGGQPPGCPPGYLCTPIEPTAGAYPPPVGSAPLGWSAGPAPSELPPGDITGSVPYSDF